MSRRSAATKPGFKPGLKKEPLKRPDVFGYHDFRAFLKDWFAYLKERDSAFSVRALTEEMQVAQGYLPMVLSGARNLSAEALAKLLPRLHLRRSEIPYFENLVKLGTFASIDGRLQAVDKMSRYSSYRKKNPAEADFFQYASHWHHLAIREMVNLPDFKLDPEWIQQKLKFKVPLRTIQESLDFLTRAGYIQVTPESTIAPNKETLRVEGKVFAAALIQSHKQMFALATESIDKTPEQERNILGYTFSLDTESYSAAQGIINQALQQLIDLEEKSRAKKDAVYQVELALFPLTNRGGK